MVDESKRESAATAMRQVDQAWLDRRSEDLASMGRYVVRACASIGGWKSPEMARGVPRK